MLSVVHQYTGALDSKPHVDHRNEHLLLHHCDCSKLQVHSQLSRLSQAYTHTLPVPQMSSLKQFINANKASTCARFCRVMTPIESDSQQTSPCCVKQKTSLVCQKSYKSNNQQTSACRVKQKGMSGPACCCQRRGLPVWWPPWPPPHMHLSLAASCTPAFIPSQAQGAFFSLYLLWM